MDESDIFEIEQEKGHREGLALSNIRHQPRQNISSKTKPKTRMLRRLLTERTGLMAGQGGHDYTQLGEIITLIFYSARSDLIKI